MRVSLPILIALMLVVGAGGSRAHGDWPARHGGLKNNDGAEVSFELVVRGRGIVIYLEDHGEPMSALGARGVLELARGDSVRKVALASSGGNRLAGRAWGPLLKGDRLVAKLSFANGSIAEGHFHHR